MNMSEAEVKAATLTLKIRTALAYVVLFFKYVLDWVIKAAAITTAFLFIILVGGILYQMGQGAAISASFDMIPLIKP